MKTFSVAWLCGWMGVVGGLWMALTAWATAAERPNVVWILSEDNSVHYMRLYDENGPATPRIEQLAEAGLTFDAAFSNSPVCSVARTTLMTSVYAPRLGTQFHRRIQPARLPEGWNLFPAYLRTAGYYTTNNSKEDYNTAGHRGVWDESSRQATWRKRPEGAAFFHMHTFTTTHESSLQFPVAQVRRQNVTTDPAQVTVHPYHPDTELMRFTVARYHDRMQTMDRQVGQLVDQLAADGLLEDTFIFYFGDHGGVLPRSKGYVYDLGLHVPLVVRIPENFKHLVDREAGSRVPGFVSFIDLGPTTLHLAGVEVPAHLDGQPFLGRDIAADEVDRRDLTFGYADRFDEKYDMVRSVRQGRYKYIRNFTAMYPDALNNNYRYQMPAYAEWRELHRQGELPPQQAAFFAPRPAEGLFDIEADSYEMNNLASDPAHADRLRELRAVLNQWLVEMPDLSLFPESVLVDQALDQPIAFGQRQAEPIAKLLETANLALEPPAAVAEALIDALASDDPWQRAWAVVALSIHAAEPDTWAPRVRPLLEDPEPLVRVRVAEYLGIVDAADPVPTLMQVLKTSETPVESLIALNTVVFLRDGPRGYRFSITPDDVAAKNPEVQRRLLYLKP